MQTLEDYKEDFKDCIIAYCKRYNHGEYTEEDLIKFEQIAQDEYDGLLRNIDIKDIDFEKGAEDANECMTYWEA